MMSESEPSKGPLGQSTPYVSEYDPRLLFPVSRAEGREALGVTGELPFAGRDWWTGYELSWLNGRGKPEVALVRIGVPCDSPNLIESKSLKLYLNSFNQTRLSGREELTDKLKADLSRAAGAPVAVWVSALSAKNLPVSEPAGECLDSLDVAVDRYRPEPGLLSAAGEPVEETLYSHLLKSNCPVTGQPDWATLSVSYRGPRIGREGLLRYIVSYREHQDFHEHCVERMFLDIRERCRPECLTVCARYTRRGGLDINPVRSTDPLDEQPPSRLVRQ